MFKNLKLSRPICSVDTETTGDNPASCWAVEVAIVRYEANGDVKILCERFNPQAPIATGAFDKHGISEADVADKPLFRERAEAYLVALADADICGYQVRFDIQVLGREFRRAGLALSMDRRILDPKTIFFQREPRDLSAASKRYCGEEHEGAHGALADALKAASVLDNQLAEYIDLPRTVDELAAVIQPNVVDVGGVFKTVGGQVVFSRGKHEGKPLGDVAARHRDYLLWMLKPESGFMDDALTLVRQALATLEQCSQGRFHFGHQPDHVQERM